MMSLNLSKIKKVFFIGIGGIGISALAKMTLSLDMEVSGVDDESYKTHDSLIENGVEILFQKDMKDLPDADLYVYSDAWLYRGPEIIENARKTGSPVMSYFEALGQFAKDYKVIAISGTHGKTTTTAMIAEVLIDAGLDPTVIVGSFVKKFNSNFRKGNSKPARPDGHSGRYLVVEADEYMKHFLNFTPFITVITNIEADHLDYYKDLADIQKAFGDLVSQTENFVVYNSKDINTSVLVSEYQKGGGRVKVVDYSKYVDQVPRLLVPGQHNRLDAAAAYAVAEILGISEEIAQKSLAQFSGTWRRLEKRGVTSEGAIVYDDYSHHPTEVRAAIQGLRELYPSKKLTILFQPHLYSRTKALFNDFVTCFKDADRVLILPIYFAREDKDESVSSEKLAEAIAKNARPTEQSFGRGDNAVAFADFQSAEQAVLALNLGPNDVFVTMGAGEAYKIADSVYKLV